MKKHIFYLVASLLVFVSCNKFDGDDARLYGSWSNGAQKYNFYSDKSYSIENLLKGDSINPITYDSIFGVYNIDEKRSNITFDQKGAKLDSNDVIEYKNVNSSTWNYEIKYNDADTTLEYESTTTTGILTKE